MLLNNLLIGFAVLLRSVIELFFILSSCHCYSTAYRLELDDAPAHVSACLLSWATCLYDAPHRKHLMSQK